MYLEPVIVVTTVFPLKLATVQRRTLVVRHLVRWATLVVHAASSSKTKGGTPINGFWRLLACITVVVSVTSAIMAQDAADKLGRASAPAVTAAASAELFRFTAPSHI